MMKNLLARIDAFLFIDEFGAKDITQAGINVIFTLVLILATSILCYLLGDA